MKIEAFLSQGCASRHALEANIREALVQEGLEAKISFLVVGEQEARTLGIPGSPTVFLNGEDLEGLRLLEGTVS
ncbi:MAG: hypothetical protein WHX93_01910 [bacterium]